MNTFDNYKTKIFCEMNNTLRIFCKNTNTCLNIAPGTSLRLIVIDCDPIVLPEALKSPGVELRVATVNPHR